MQIVSKPGLKKESEIRESSAIFDLPNKQNIYNWNDYPVNNLKLNKSVY